MDLLEIEHLLSDKLSNLLHTSGADGGQTLGFAGWHASPNGHVVVNVRVSSEGGHYRCRISSTEGGYSAEGPVADTPASFS